MSAVMVPYVVRPGDYLGKLAHQHGFDAEEVWGDPKNKEIREQRSNHNMLVAGDLIYIPKAPKKDGLPVAAAASNRYQAAVPSVSVHLVFTRPPDGVPIANEPYELEGVGLDGAGDAPTTDGSGGITLDVPLTTSLVTVIFPREGLRFPVKVGDLDPPTETSGIKQRLKNLGYWSPGSGDAEAEAESFAHSVSTYQKRKDLPVTGVVDDATRDAIVADHKG